MSAPGRFVTRPKARACRVSSEENSPTSRRQEVRNDCGNVLRLMGLDSMLTTGHFTQKAPILITSSPEIVAESPTTAHGEDREVLVVDAVTPEATTSRLEKERSEVRRGETFLATFTLPIHSHVKVPRNFIPTRVPGSNTGC